MYYVDAPIGFVRRGGIHKTDKKCPFTEQTKTELDTNTETQKIAQLCVRVFTRRSSDHRCFAPRVLFFSGSFERSRKDTAAGTGGTEGRRRARNPPCFFFLGGAAIVCIVCVYIMQPLKALKPLVTPRHTECKLRGCLSLSVLENKKKVLVHNK